jgi:NAD(P)-dependent dehydrogenase (short-subunit alcohol dehydrogenase family)
MTGEVALVTGASSGIGEATALELVRRGFVVYGVARRLDRMAGLAALGVHTFEMDVTDDTSITSGVERILREQGRIDVLVNNAGYGSYGALEDVPIDEARRQFEVNVFGLARLTQLVLPHMRAQRSGRIVNVSSIGGKFYEPLGAWYHATKFAVEGMSDSLRLELQPHGVHVIVIEPGSIRTEWGSIAAESAIARSGSTAYGLQAKRLAAVYDIADRPGIGTPPQVVGVAIAKAVTARRPRTRYVVPFAAKSILLLRRILTDRAFDWVILRAYGPR